MLKILTLLLLPVLNLIALPVFYIPIDTLHPVRLSTYRLLVSDAIIRKTQDTIIFKLENKIAYYESYSIMREQQFNVLINIERDKTKKQTEMTKASEHMQVYYRKLGNKFKKQRNIAIGVVIIATTIYVLKPP